MSDLTPEQKLRKHEELIAKLDRTTCALKKDMTELKGLSHSTSTDVSTILREILGNEKYRADGIVHKQEMMQKQLNKLDARIPHNLDAKLQDMEDMKNIIRDIGKWGTVISVVVFFISGLVYSIITGWNKVVQFFNSLSSN